MKLKTKSPDIRPATSKDITELAAFSVASFMDTFAHMYTPENLALFLEKNRSETYYAGAVANTTNRVWIVRDVTHSGTPQTGPIIGFAKVGPNSLPLTSPQNSALELAQLYIDKDHQGKGIGQSLLDLAQDYASRHAYLEMILGVYCENVGAQRLYARNGFSKIGEYDFPVGTHIDREFIMLKTL